MSFSFVVSLVLTISLLTSTTLGLNRSQKPALKGGNAISSVKKQEHCVFIFVSFVPDLFQEATNVVGVCFV